MATSIVIAENYGLLVSCLLFISASGSSRDMPPQIEFPVSQVRQLVAGYESQDYMVQCKASGYPLPTFQWKKDDLLLDDTQDSVKAFQNGSLYFKQFTDSDNGLYQCFASNKFGTSVSVKVPIVNKKNAVKSDNLSTEPVRYTVQSGQPWSLNCTETPVTVPRWNKRWYLSYDSKEVEMTNRVGTDSEGTLRFVYVQQSDARSYTCGLVPTSLSPYDSIIMYNTIELKITPSSTGMEIQPRREYKTDNVKAMLGDNVVLECFFSGSPVPNITWTNSSNHKIGPHNVRFKIEDFGRRLTIQRVKEDDQGTYSCTADNGFGINKQFIHVNVTSPPMKLPHKGLISVVKPDRSGIILQCKAHAAFNQRINVPIWYRNGQQIDSDSVPEPNRYSFNKDYTELYIENLSKTKDTACFQCNISNSEGYVFYDGYLKVIESIKITQHPNRIYEISTNDAVDISVQATGDSCCSIIKEWYLNGTRLTQEELNNPPFITDRKNGTLLFDPRGVSNETLVSRLGNYKCNVSNGYDFQEFEFTISMKAIVPAAEKLTMATGGLELWWVMLICGLLIVFIAAVAIFIFIKTNYPGQTYQLEKTEIKHNLDPKADLINQSFQEI